MYLKMEGFHSAARANITEEQPGADGESIAQSEHVVFHWSSVCACGGQPVAVFKAAMSLKWAMSFDAPL